MTEINHVCPNCQSINPIHNHNEVWVEVESCECCGNSTTIHIDYTCPACGYIIDVTFQENLR